MPKVEVHIVASTEKPTGVGEPGDAGHRSRRSQRDCRSDRKAPALASSGDRMKAALLSMLRLAGLMLVVAASALHAEPGVTPTSILIGQSAAFSGAASELGTEMRTGAAAYFRVVNAAGGVHGRKIEMRSLDDGYESDRAAANTKKLIDDGVFLLFGYVGTPTSNASKPIFTAARVPFVGPFTGAESLRTPLNRYIFNVRASYFDETEKIVGQMTGQALDKIAVFYQNDDYGKAGLAGVEARDGAAKHQDRGHRHRRGATPSTLRRRSSRSARSSRRRSS